MPSTKFLIIYFGLGAIATILELVRPTRKLNYWARDAVILDVCSWFFYQFVVVFWANFLRNHIPVHFTATRWLLAIPWQARIVVYYIVGDFSSYWMHRLTHTKYLWRVHHYHHSPTQMWWMAGVRSTVWQQTLSNLPYILWAPLAVGAPNGAFTILLFLNVFTNHWMHMNFSWRSNWLEYIFVTPRSHHIHHSNSQEHYDTNFGVVFSVWDHMFGTFVNPDKTKVTGIGAADLENPVQAWWLMMGIFNTEPDGFLRKKVDPIAAKVFNSKLMLRVRQITRI